MSDGVVMPGLINHGQGLDLDPANVECFALDEEMKLHRVPVGSQQAQIVIDMELDVWCELVFGPKGQTSERLFEGKSP